MPDVSISMPARNAAAFIGRAIESIQQQTDITWELIVVDDASEDETAQVVRSFQDPRIRLLQNETRRGISYSHNRALAAGTAPFVAHVDADDYILPGALLKLVQALQANPRAGQAHCQFYDIDAGGNVLRDVMFRRIRMYERRPAGMDYRRELIAVGMVAGHLRTYARRALDTVGTFNEALSFGEDYEMALRILEHYEIAFVPEFLYVRRLHTHNTTESLPFKKWQFFWQRYQICRALERSRRVTYFHQPPYALNRLLLQSLLDTVGVWRAQMFLRDRVWSLPRRAYTALQVRVVTPTLDRLYEFAVNHGAWWRLHWRARPSPSAVPARIGYYVWHFPVLSQSFLRREVQALRDAGLGVELFADEPGEQADPALVSTTHYLLPRDPARVAWAKHFFARRFPLRYWNAFMYVILHRYGAYKTWREDMHVLAHAVELARVLRKNNIRHLHAPWADRTAFIALVAAALLDIPYSVEARAHDLHRVRSQYGLEEKFSNARFILTNSNYNARAIETYLPVHHAPPLHVLPELFPLDRFTAPAPQRPYGEFRILCVARLIEEKGLVYLLDACADLRARGMAFHCEIIGAPEEPLYTTYLLALKRRYQHLQLQDCVSFAGSLPFERVLAAYAGADLFVLPCVIAENGGRDISPNALIEAMAMGLPVISTQLSAIPEIVEHGVSGILVPPNDAPALAGAMAELMQDAPRRGELGARARARAAELYAAQKNVARYVAVFQPDTACRAS